jgi:hypothetical protein
MGSELSPYILGPSIISATDVISAPENTTNAYLNVCLMGLVNGFVIVVYISRDSAKNHSSPPNKENWHKKQSTAQ